MFAILSRLYIIFLNFILHDLNNLKILLYKLFVRNLIVKPVCVNAALGTHLQRWRWGHNLRGQGRGLKKSEAKAKDQVAEDRLSRCQELEDTFVNTRKYKCKH